MLRSVALRGVANQMAYHDKARHATEDALRVGRLHTHLPAWEDMNVAFMRSGGYRISQQVKDVGAPVLVVWGRQDEILEPANAERFLVRTAASHSPPTRTAACRTCLALPSTHTHTRARDHTQVHTRTCTHTHTHTTATTSARTHTP